MIDYDHKLNAHGVDGPRAAFGAIFSEQRPQSLLDVGCGTGTWMRAALDVGIDDIIGIDGVTVQDALLVVPRQRVCVQDLTQPWNLHRKFDAVLCLEVAEHLDEAHADTLIDSLVKHSDWIVFSAACPGQGGQHHVNCQWPMYWQELFNAHGYVCDDRVRWRLWEDSRIEPWYRQNLFVARRNSTLAGTEPRLLPVMHPEIHKMITNQAVNQSFETHVGHINIGRMPVGWYLSTPPRALVSKVSRFVRRRLGT
jgi:hypothetical protein